jgi:predicted phosphoribosyltransferase
LPFLLPLMDLGVRIVSQRFHDRSDAGVRLATALQTVVDPNALLLALPRGGVIVAAAAAEFLHSQMDVYVVRKIGSSISAEFAIGAVAEDGPPLLDQRTIDQLRIDRSFIEDAVRTQRQEIARQVDEFRSGRSLPLIQGRTAVLVDDGIATGATVRAAVLGIRTHQPAKIVVAAPVASQGAVSTLREETDEVLVLRSPSDFFAVGQYYANFEQVSDQEVKFALQLSQNERS